MKLKTRDLPARLRLGETPVAVLLYGADQGLVLAQVGLLRQRALADDDGDFDAEIFYGGDLDEARFLASCRAFPLAAPRRFVTLKEGDRLAPAAQKTVLEYLKRPSQTTLLVITATALDVRNALRKGFESHKIAWCVPFYPLEGVALQQWLGTRLREDGFTIDAEALHHLAQRLSGDTRAAAEELEKLRQFMGNQRQIDVAAVYAVVGETAVYTPFALAGAVTAGQVGEALHTLDRLLAAGEEPIALLGMIAQRLRKLAQAGGLLADGENPKAVAVRLKVFWKEQTTFFAQTHALPPRRLADALLACQKADAALKSGGNPPDRILSRLVMHLATRLGGRPPPNRSWR